MRWLRASGWMSLVIACTTAFVACDESISPTAAPSTASVDAGVDGAPAAADAGSVTDAADASDANAVCHALVNDAPIVQATVLSSPFPTNVGLGGDITGGTYSLTSVAYYADAPAVAKLDGGFAMDASTDASSDGGIPVGIYWRTTIEAHVTLGTNLVRTWHTSKKPDLSDSPEHREILLLEPASPTTVNIKPICTDEPLAGEPEYTATANQFVLYVGGSNRMETYTRR